MRYRMGKGQTAAFDAELEKRLEKMRDQRGYYPSLREIGESFSPPEPAHRVFKALHRLSAAGRLSPAAELVYNSKHKTRYADEQETGTKKSKSHAAR